MHINSTLFIFLLVCLFSFLQGIWVDIKLSPNLNRKIYMSAHSLSLYRTNLSTLNSQQNGKATRKESLPMNETMAI